MRIFFASDFHGSDICFKKFLNARKFYSADALLLGGDLCAKSVALAKETEQGWDVRVGNRLIHFDDAPAFEDYKLTLAHSGYLLESDNNLDIKKTTGEKGASTDVNSYSQLERWLDLAKRVSSDDPIYFVGGNDDPLYLDEILGPPFVNVHARHIPLDDRIAVLGLGGSTPTPWHTYREYSEVQFEEFIANSYDERLRDRKLVLFSHCPPYGSGLDLAPALREDLSYELHLGMAHPVPVGSKAIRTAIHELKPLLALSGHVHESRRYARLNGTLCINPGSVFWTGRLQGCIVDIVDGKVGSFQLTEG